MLVLREKYRDELIGIFNAVDESFEVWAFGSRVNGGAHDGSDLDLVIRTPTLQAMPVNALSDLKDAISESNIPIVIDIHDWARIPESFHKNIQQKHELLFKR
jgi:predicted nucleotidyltransferase